MPATKENKANNIQMAIEMETLVPEEPNLDNLPPDIIRKLLRLNGMRGVQRLRLISTNWNTVVCEHLKDRRNHPQLDMVRIDSSVAQWHTKNLNLALDLNDDDQAHYHGVFRFWPRRFAGMHIDTETMTNKVQIKSPKLMIGVDKEKSFFTIIYILIAIFAAFRVHIYVAILLLVAIVAVLAWLYFTVVPSVAENRLHLHRIFDRCSHIDALVLLELDQRTTKIVRESLTNVPVYKLFIVDKKCGDRLREQVVEMARKHQVDRVTIGVVSCKPDNLQQFFHDVIESAGALFIYEKSTKAEGIFGQTREFWEEQATEMSNDSFIVQVMDGDMLFASSFAVDYVLRLRVVSTRLPLERIRPKLHRPTDRSDGLRKNFSQR